MSSRPVVQSSSRRREPEVSAAEGLSWFKSQRSGNANNCLEVAFHEGDVLVRDSKDRSGPMLRFTSGEWDAFLHGAKNGEFDPS